MIVVDANVMVAALVDPAEKGDAARSGLIGDDDWAAPSHMPFEVLRTLHKNVLCKQLASADADAATQALAAMQITYQPTDALILHGIWALRHNVSAYDAAYLVVAILHQAPLLTFDARLAKAAALTTPETSVTLL